MPRAPRKCPAPDCEHRFTGTRNTCPSHGPSPSSRASWSRPERNRRTEAVAAWVARHGWVCPGYQREQHESRDLTAAHSVAVSQGGQRSALTVLCRACNSRQGTAPTR